MDKCNDSQSVCERIEHLLESLARGRANGAISEKGFVELLLKIEREQVVPSGFRLTASNTLDNWTVFEIREKGETTPCASFEFLPESGEFRRPGSGPKTLGS
jgi:hypothetical protein